MMIYLTPQMNHNEIFEFEFEGDTITVTLNEETDIFDFSVLDVGDIVEGIETELSTNPIISVERREDGHVWVELLNFYPYDEPENIQDTLNPEWREANG